MNRRRHDQLNRLSNLLPSSIIISSKLSMVAVCKDCGNYFMKFHRQIRCKLCAHVYRRGEVYQLWSKEVKERDGFRCQVCGSTKDIEAHHIIAVSKDPSLSLELTNGITLCVNHHRTNSNSVHRILGTQGTTESFSVWFESVKASTQSSLDDY